MNKKINYGGLFRCCIATIEQYPDNPAEGTIIDCLYEGENNKQIIFKNGTFQWNQEKQLP